MSYLGQWWEKAETYRKMPQCSLKRRKRTTTSLVARVLGHSNRMLRVYTPPVTTFDPSFIWYLILGSYTLTRFGVTLLQHLEKTITVRSPCRSVRAPHSSTAPAQRVCVPGISTSLSHLHSNRKQRLIGGQQKEGGL